MSSLPYIKFYPSDWLSEESLRLVSVAARGLWIDLLCLMAKSERRGYLQVNGGVNPTLAQVGKLVGLSEPELTPLLHELRQAGTCSVEPETGVLFSRRLVRDTELYNQAVNYGSKGGNPRLKKRRLDRVNPTLNPNRQPSLGSNMGSGNCLSEALPLEELIYRAYPRKEAKQAALAAIRKVLTQRGEWRDKLLPKVNEYALAVSRWPEPERQYVPHPATWFNSGRYEDDPAAWVRRANGINAQPVRVGDNLR